jgi:diguanylate cyclase (GGDEF)-like protein
VTDVQAIGRPASELLAHWPVLEDAAGGEREVTVQHDGTESYYHMQRSLIRAADGTHAGYVFVLFDITARKSAERQLEALARTDPLTSLLNRRAFFEAAERAWARAQRQGHIATVLMFDLDHFKGVNDRYGHHAGDSVLQRVAATCQGQLREGDLFARYGGEEFICLLGEGTAEAGVALAERLRVCIERAEIVVDGQLIPVTLSVGVAGGYARRDESLTQLISAADQMLYQSKAGGRNRVTVVAAAPSAISDLVCPDTA